MYRNFSINEKEKRQILEMHTSNGYKRSLNEEENKMGDESLEIMSTIEKVYGPKGLVRDKNAERTLGPGYIVLSKGSEGNNAQVMFKGLDATKGKGMEISWSLSMKGKTLVNKKTPVGIDFNKDIKLSQQIINDLKPFFI